MILKIENFVGGLLAIMIVTTHLFGDVITTPGRYTIGGDRIYPPTGDMLSVRVSNVTIEFDAHSMAGGINGIVIESGVSGVSIQNGFIGYTANAGILIKDNTSIVHIKNMSFANCYGPAIQIMGTVTGVSNVFIEETSISDCALAPSASAVIAIDNADTVVVRDSVIDYCGNISSTVNIVEIKNSYSSVLMNLLIAECRGATMHGVLLDHATRCLVEEVRLIDNISDTGNFTGFLLQNADSNSISLSKVITVSSVSGDAIGFELANSSGNKIMHSEVGSLEGANAYGFYVHGSGTPSDNTTNHFGDCMVMDNVALTGTACGMLISRADSSCICDSMFCNNVAMNGIGAGILFAPGMGGNRWMVSQTEMAHNMGMDNASSYGIYLATGDENFFFKNVAFENGDDVNNQLVGLSANSISLADPDLVNTLTLPWTNVGVAA